MDLTGVADELYALTPDDFTGTRNDRAKEARAQDRDVAEAIRKLPKPSTAAWAVNMLVRHRADEISQVLDLGVALREAQQDLDAEQLRDLNRQRRQLTAAVTAQARTVAGDLGVRLSQPVADQVEETLRAAMTDEGAAQAVRTGQLVEALSATGVGELDVSTAVAVPAAIGVAARPVERRKPKLAVVPEPRPDDGKRPDEAERAERAEREQREQREQRAERVRARDEARQAAERAEAEAAKAARKLDKAQKRVTKLEARGLQLQGELEEVRRRVSELEHELEVVDEELAAAEERREWAQGRREKAAAAVDEAEATLAELDR
jgi:hypothetical protein